MNTDYYITPVPFLSQRNMVSLGWYVSMEYLVEWELGRETEVLEGKLFQCYFVHHKSSHSLSWDQTRAAAVGSQQTAWVMALPFKIPPKQLYLRRWSPNITEIIENRRRSFRETNSRSANHEIPHLLRYPKIHYHVHKSLFFVPILTKLNVNHTLTAYFLNTHTYILLGLRSSKNLGLLYDRCLLLHINYLLFL
jgi:hypothetical protein